MQKSGTSDGRADSAEDIDRRNSVLSKALHQAAEAVLVLDREFHITYVNPAFQRILGYAPEDVLGQPLSILSVPGQSDSLQPAEIARRVHESGWWHGEVQRLAKDGSAIPFKLTASAIRDERGGITGYVGTYLDLREIQYAEQRFQSLIEHSSDIITLLDHSGVVLYMSPSVQRVLGRAPEELLGKDPIFLVHPEDVSGTRRILAEALQNPGKVYHLEFRLQHADGHYIDVESVGRSLAGDSTGPSVVFNTRDITEHKQAETALRESEEKFRGLVETTTDWIWQVDEHGVYTYASPQVRNILGYEPEEIVGKTPFDLMPASEAERIREVYKSVVASQKPYHLMENLNLHKNGSMVVLETSGAPIFDQAGAYKGSRGIDRDITARKQAEDALRHANRALKTMSACNSVLVHATDEAQLINAMCRVIVETGDYSCAWIGYAEHDDTKRIQPVAQAGFEPGFFQNLHLTWADNDAGQNPVGTAIRKGVAAVVHDATNDPSLVVWRPALARFGVNSICVFPLTIAGETFGVLSICSRERDAFEQDELTLLTELSEDMNFGIHTLRTRTERDHAVEGRERGLKKLRASLETTIGAIAATLEIRDPYTAGHERRVAELATAIAREMGLPQAQVEGIHFGALIHDLGKIKVPAEILSKPSVLTRLEFEMVKEHAQSGYDILKGIEFPWPVAEMALEHHERVDGSGYPRGLKGCEMKIESRILAVADVVEAMASHRPYRPALGIELALAEIMAHRGTLYDTDAVNACVRLYKEKGFTPSGS
jgi:PAS domain S-box-containing protein/putative nucleotidyltransferase with HDIG domain